MELLDGCRGFIYCVEYAISKPIGLVASMAVICCVFCHLATLGVEILLHKLKQNRHSDMEYTF